MATAAQTPTPIRLFEIAGKVVLIKEPWLDAWAKTRECKNTRSLLQQWLEGEYFAYLNNERWIKTPAPASAVSNSNVLPDGEQRMAWGRLSRADEDRVVVALLQKTTIRDIAVRFRIGETTVRRIRQRRMPTPEKIQTVLFLWTRTVNGEQSIGGIRAIAERCGVSEHIANAIIQNHAPLTPSSTTCGVKYVPEHSSRKGVASWMRGVKHGEATER